MPVCGAKGKISDAAVEAEEAEALRTENAELKDRLLRALADTENLRKRAERDRRDAELYGATRFARDLHDILGHSLTVLTVKAELAGRLVGIDPPRAEREIAEVEQLVADLRAQRDGAELDRQLQESDMGAPNGKSASFATEAAAAMAVRPRIS